MNAFFGEILKLGEFIFLMKKTQILWFKKYFSPFFEIKVIKVVTLSLVRALL
jgi:hypothetical protein